MKISRPELSAFFLLFSVATILLHTVIPHHHHQDKLCFEKNQSCCESCDHDEKHDHETEQCNCVLSDLFFADNKNLSSCFRLKFDYNSTAIIVNQDIQTKYFSKNNWLFIYDCLDPGLLDVKDLTRALRAPPTA